MNSRHIPIFLAIISLGLGSASFAAVSVDQELAGSPQVVRGFLTRLEAPRSTLSGSFASITVRVEEVVRGEHIDDVTVDLPLELARFLPKPLPNHEPELLLMMNGTKSTHFSVDTLYRLDLQPPSRYPGADAGITIDCKRLTQRHELLEYVRAICKVPFQWAGSIHFLVPGASRDDRMQWVIDMQQMDLRDRLKVPLTARTRDHAIEWCHSSDPEWRLAGVEVLSAFDDPVTKNALIGELADAASVEVGRAAGHYRWFYVRQAANVALAKKKTHIPFHVVEENWLDYATVGWWIWLVPVSAAFLMLATCWIVCRREEREMWLPWVIFILAVFPSVFLVVEQGHTTGRVDEVIVSGRVCHRAASFNGVLQYTLIEAWPDSQPFKIGSFELSRSDYSDPEFNAVICNYWGLEDSPQRLPIDGFPGWFNWGKQSLEGSRKVLSSHHLGHAAIASGTVGDAMGVPRIFHTFRLPIDWLLAGLIVPPSLYLLHSWRSRRRSNRWRRGGCCAICGYNLRHATERCPECGSPAVSA